MPNEKEKLSKVLGEVTGLSESYLRQSLRDFGAIADTRRREEPFVSPTPTKIDIAESKFDPVPFKNDRAAAPEPSPAADGAREQMYVVRDGALEIWNFVADFVEEVDI